MKVERVSYDVMTPSAARGILEAIHWKPAIRWVIDTIHVLNPIRFESIKRNEVKAKISATNAIQAMRRGRLEGLEFPVDDGDNRQPRHSTILRDVSYVIEAHFMLTAKAGADDTPAKHQEMFMRRAEKGQCFHQPCLGTREFPAEFEPWEGAAPKPHADLMKTADLGWMLYDINFADGNTPVFYRPTMIDGLIDVAKHRPEEAAS
jgi:CRISPR-associated protein Cas5d